MRLVNAVFILSMSSFEAHFSKVVGLITSKDIVILSKAVSCSWEIVTVMCTANYFG